MVFHKLEPSASRAHRSTGYLVGEDGEAGLSRSEHTQDLLDEAVVVTLRYVSLEADVCKLRFRGNVDSPVLTLRKSEGHQVLV